jgi:predicted nucleotidyltransferase
MLPIIQQISNEFKAGLLDLYGDELESLILFGSYARGDYHEESDIDYAFVLRQTEVSDYNEIKRTSRIAVLLGMKYGFLLSAFPIPDNKMRTSTELIYRNIRKEGILI